MQCTARLQRTSDAFASFPCCSSAGSVSIGSALWLLVEGNDECLSFGCAGAKGLSVAVCTFGTELDDELLATSALLVSAFENSKSEEVKKRKHAHIPLLRMRFVVASQSSAQQRSVVYGLNTYHIWRVFEKCHCNPDGNEMFGGIFASTNCCRIFRTNDTTLLHS